MLSSLYSAIEVRLCPIADTCCCELASERTQIKFVNLSHSYPGEKVD